MLWDDVQFCSTVNCLKVLFGDSQYVLLTSVTFLLPCSLMVFHRICLSLLSLTVMSFKKMLFFLFYKLGYSTGTGRPACTLNMRAIELVDYDWEDFWLCRGRIWTMVAGGGASVIYADTICALGGSEELGRRSYTALLSFWVIEKWELNHCGWSETFGFGSRSHFSFSFGYGAGYKFFSSTKRKNIKNWKNFEHLRYQA